MLARTPIGNRFYQWVNRQDPDRRYEWTNNCGCACGLFLIEELGLEQTLVQASLSALNFPLMTIEKPDADAMEVWRMFNLVAYGNVDDDGVTFPAGEKAWTFGELAKRIRAKLPEVV